MQTAVMTETTELVELRRMLAYLVQQLGGVVVIPTSAIVEHQGVRQQAAKVDDGVVLLVTPVGA